MSDGISELYSTFSENKLLFGKMYFPHYFRKSSPAFHMHIIEVAGSNLNTAIQAPRGSAKSTVETFLDPTHGIVFKKERFIIIVQDTHSKACANLDSIKAEFRENERLRKDFGITMDKKDAQGDTIFTHPDGYSVRVLCKGADQLGSIRGEKFGAYRPTLILVDDLEDDELVRNPDRRMEMEKQFNEVLNYAGEAGETRIVVIGTILHDDSLMAKLLDRGRYKRFKKLFYRARMTNAAGDVISIWPEKWSLDDLKEMENEDPVGFAKEMMGDPSSGSMETVHREDFRYWQMETVGSNAQHAVLYNEDGTVYARWGMHELKGGIGVDLAWEQKTTNDFSAFMPGYVTPKNDLLFDNYVMKKGMRPEDWENTVFDMAKRMEDMTGKRVAIGMEKSKLEKVMKWFLLEAQRRRNEWLWFKDVSYGGKDKLERFYSRLANRYSQHAVFHKRGMGEYENQAIRLRTAKNDDLCDCASILAEILHYGPSQNKAKPEDDKFKFLQTQTPLYREKNRQRYVFGMKTKRSPLLSKVGI